MIWTTWIQKEIEVTREPKCAVFISIFLTGTFVKLPPRFKTFNGEEVSVWFAYLSSVFEGVMVEPGTKWNITVEVSDANGDDIVPYFRVRKYEFDQETHGILGYSRRGPHTFNFKYSPSTSKEHPMSP